MSEAVLRLAMLAQYYELSPAAPRDSESWAQLARKLLALLAQWVRVGALLLPDLELDASHAQALLALLQVRPVAATRLLNLSCLSFSRQNSKGCMVVVVGGRGGGRNLGFL